jgi:hypothetical protein
VSPLIAPCEEASLQVDFFEYNVIQNPTELPHGSTVQLTVVLVFAPINHIEVAAHKPGSLLHLCALTQMLTTILLLQICS